MCKICIKHKIWPIGKNLELIGHQYREEYDKGSPFSTIPFPPAKGYYITPEDGNTIVLATGLKLSIIGYNKAANRIFASFRENNMIEVVYVFKDLDYV